MIKNYFKIALRNLWKHRVFSFLNIMGLTVGMTAAFLIFIYVKFELSYDSFHTKSDRIYRAICDIKTPTETMKMGGPSWAVVPHLMKEFPQIEAAVRVAGNSLLVRKGDVKFQEENSVFADSLFFKMFDFKLISGDPKTALNEPMSVVFSETAAKKYFGKQNPVGQTVLLTGDSYPVKVTGLMKDIPENSIVKADMIVSMTSLTRKLNPGLDNQWGNYGCQSFLLLKPGTSYTALQAQLPKFLERQNGTEMKQMSMFPTIMLEPLRDVYLRSTRDGSKTGNINNVYIFSIIAIFILLIACINFVNLTTARSAERAKEVGIRKVVGAGKPQLAIQFVGESVMLCVIAFIFSFILAACLISPFNTLSGKVISTGIFEHGSYILLLFVAAIGIGLLAGLYPALVLSSYQPISVLKGRFATGTKGSILRKTLVISQFAISVALIIATLIVDRQMSFMQHQDLGFKKDQILVVDSNGDSARDAFGESIKQLPAVKSVAMSSSVPGGGNMAAYSEIENVKGVLQVANLDLYFVDWNYIPEYQIKMVSGRAFDRSFGTDTTQAMILNEAAVKLFGYRSAKDAVGRRFKQWGREGKIIGVMKDFHFRSLQEEIKPLSMRIEPGGCSMVSINVSAGNMPGTISAIENKWKAYVPNRPFSYFFLDEFFDKQYRSDQRFGKLFLNFAILAIFISCLGLLGLASYSTIQRTKEIGVRKVMGASVSNIVGLLSKDFIILVLISFLIAAPVSWYFMHKWLQDFAYRVSISWWIFASACLLAVLIALVTISFQAVRAAIANPIKSLRAE